MGILLLNSTLSVIYPRGWSCRALQPIINEIELWDISAIVGILLTKQLRMANKLLENEKNLSCLVIVKVKVKI